MLRVAPEFVDPQYLSFYLSSSETYAWLRTNAVGAVMPNLNSEVLARTPLVLPPLSEQRAIAHVLGPLDDKIALLRAMNQTLEETCRTLFRSWFVDFDPVRAKAAGRKSSGMSAEIAKLFPDELVDSKGGEIPKGWTRAPLGEWATALSGGTPSMADATLWGGDFPWISPKVMTELHADEAEQYVTTAAIGNGTRLAPAGATLVMVRGMGLHKEVRVSQARRDVSFNQDVKALVSQAIEPPLLFFAMLDAQAYLLKKVESSGHGTGKLPSDVLMGLPITMPLIEIQKKLAPTFDTMNARIASSREEARTLAHARDELLPKLLSGALRIPDPERFLQEAGV